VTSKTSRKAALAAHVRPVWDAPTEVKGSPMKRRNLAGAFVAGAVAVLVAAPPVAAAPAPTFPPVDGGASVQTLTPSRPSTPALDDAFLSDLTRAGIRIADVPTVIFGAHDTCAYLAAGHTAMEAVDTGMHNNATMTRADEIAYVDAAISVYCPRYLGLTGTLA